jgi:hypothetical protein
MASVADPWRFFKQRNIPFKICHAVEHGIKAQPIPQSG